MFSVGWWLWIDGHVYSNTFAEAGEVTFWHYVPGICSTLALIMLNLVDLKDLGGISWGFAEDGRQTRIRLWFFLSLVIAFGSLIGAVWSASVHWFDARLPYQWPGVALIVQNVCIFASALLYRFNAPPQESEFNVF
uniref:Transmembrane protein 50A n=1 Tax=Arcella intermedia TaxID=1963864 RepID=A0A6B2LPA9_9EUKA